MPRVRHTPSKQADSPTKTPSESSEPTASTSTSEPQDSEKMEKALKTAVRQRAQIHSKLLRIEQTLQETKEPTVSQLKVLAKNVATVYAEFSAIHTTIVGLIPDSAMAEQDGVYDEFEEVFYEASNRIEELLLAAESKTTNNKPAAAQVVIQQQPLKAPIPTFDGTYAAWPKFKAIFEDLMANAGDSDTMKLYHLEKALVGEAAGAIDVSILNAGNYKQAWEILTERFGNHRAIVDSHIHGLLNLKRMTSENFHELRALVQETSRHVESLRFLKQNLEGVSEPMVVHLLVSALDKSTRKAWEGTQRKGELPRYEQTMAFLKSRCQILENCAAASSSAPVVKLKGNHPLSPRHPAQKSYTAAVIQCEICGKDHPNINCPELLKGTPRERSNTAQKAGLCFNCLRKGHQLRECPSKRKCYKCRRRHHTLLHEDVAPTGQPTISMAAEVEPQPPTPRVHPPSTAAEYGGPVVREQLSTACASQTIKPSKNVLLLTAVVNVLDAKNQPHRCRVLLDSGSQVNFLAEEMANRLGLPKRPANVPIVGINALRTLARDKLTVTIQSRVNSYQTSLECLVTPKITGTIPSCNININNWDIPEGMTLADPTFYTPDKVDLLIGAELFFDILKPSQLDLADNLPRLQDSQFGWIVSGAIVEQQITIPAIYSHHALIDIEKMIQQFWQIEEVPDVPERSIEELECENHFLTTYQRDESGRFIVRLPFNKQQTLLNNGRTVALKRFMMLEKRLLRNPELQQQYVEFIREYETLGHCRQIRESDDVPNQLSYYLPHHAVLRPSSSSTKCRVVFDASAKASSAELSLNDVLHVGPVVQNDLYSIVLRFRMYKVAFSGDIAKMYRQILHAKEDQRFLRIFWRPHPSQPLRVFELCTVTYGTASAPFLATKCLLQLVEEDGDAFPIASRIIKEETYMDDVLSGADSVEEAIEAQHQLKRLLNQGGFPIRKWCSNSLEFLEHIPVEEQEKAIPMAERGVNQAIKVLGLLWDPKADHLYIAHQPKPVATADQRVTKLIIYSEVAKFFDPLGLVSPVIVLAKLLIQRLWKLKTDWNDPIDEGSMKQWQELQPSLQHLHRIQTQRCVTFEGATSYELHGFSDASNVAYGACIYLRSLFPDGSAKLCLLTSKSKLAPQHDVSIPRKELCAALLLTRLVQKVLPALNLKFQEIVLWCDSTIVLAWIRKPLNQLQLFVRNRIAVIQKHTEECRWEYIRSHHNPADIVSRGMLLEALETNNLWWRGPDYLHEASYMVNPADPVPEDELPELKGVMANPTVTIEPFSFF